MRNALLARLFAWVTVFLSLLFSFSALAQPSRMRFEPPDPTSRTPVLAHAHVAAVACTVDDVTVTRNGFAINIALTITTQCFAPVAADFTVDLGVMPAGAYAVFVSGTDLHTDLVVRDAHPPFEVRPNTVGSQDDVVRLIGPNLAYCAVGPSPIVCLPLSVFFGTEKAEIVGLSPDEIRVKRPPVLEGSFDVIIDRGDSTLRSTLAYHAPSITPIYADPAFYERVLLPVFWSGPGAFGAQWMTGATLYNGNEYPITAGAGTVLRTICQPICDGRPQPRQTTIANAPTSSTAGWVEILPRQAMANADLGLVSRDVSRGAQDLGTEIPVLRENDLFARPFSIANVPADARYRVTLRIYDIDAPRTIALRMVGAHSAAPLVDEGLQLAAAASMRTGGFAAINDLVAAYPKLAGQGPLRIEVDPLIRNDAKSAWAFVSITNNETQHVTVISPQ